ncbi:hypothetical protein [Synechococcus sp. CS-603]|uniref:hypothetical protein n=1 Tax=Synechococcus sp. CS-603 TaxID=2847981 RepID=UPI00223A83B7|nr:hypothetical protein [Synechococcus sp. CS-603]MCT0202162.1 hypothetical protein [Synechococcus sp. CS-603]
MAPPSNHAKLNRLASHGLGYVMATSMAVLACQGAAHALQYVFEGAVNPPDGLELDFRSPPFFFFRFTGSGTVTGSFNYVGGNVIDSINLTFTSNTANTQTFQFTGNNGYYNSSTDTLYFGVTSGGCPAGSTTCLSLNLAGTGLNNTPSEIVNFVGGTDALGDYFNAGNSNFLTATERRDLTLRSGFLRQIPAPLSVLTLLPLAGLKRYRRRLARLKATHDSPPKI